MDAVSAKDPAFLRHIYRDIAHYEFNLGNFETAIDYLKRADRQFDENIGAQEEYLKRHYEFMRRLELAGKRTENGDISACDLNNFESVCKMHLEYILN